MTALREVSIPPSTFGIVYGDTFGVKSSLGSVFPNDPGNDADAIVGQWNAFGVWVESSYFASFPLPAFIPAAATVRHVKFQFTVGPRGSVVFGPEAWTMFAALIGDGKWDVSGGFLASDYPNQADLPFVTADTSNVLIPGKAYLDDWMQGIIHVPGELQPNTNYTVGDAGYRLGSGAPDYPRPFTEDYWAQAVEVYRLLGAGYFAVTMDPIFLPTGGNAEWLEVSQADGTGTPRLIVEYEVPTPPVYVKGEELREPLETGEAAPEEPVDTDEPELLEPVQMGEATIEEPVAPDEPELLEPVATAATVEES